MERQNRWHWHHWHWHWHWLTGRSPLLTRLRGIGLIGLSGLALVIALCWPSLVQGVGANPPATKVVNTPFLQATIYLNSPQTILKLAYNSTPQPFANFVRSHASAAVVASGTFAFGRDWQLISEGQHVGGTLRFTTGTVLGIRRGNQPDMMTLKKQGTPNWNDYWFAIAAGPRLLQSGQMLPWRPEEEGFADPKVTNVDSALGRTAIGISSDRTRLYYVMFKQNVSLRRAAELMKQMGCSDAMNLEGGGTRSFAHQGKIVIPGGRPQTHAIVVYDAKHPAPAALQQAWQRF